MNISRRSFLRGTSAAAVGGAFVGANVASADEATEMSIMTAQNYKDAKWSFMVPPEPVAEDQIVETVTADIIIVGSGPSGLCTAVSCQEAGGDVILFSASSGPVGRGGSNAAFGTKVQAEFGVEYSPEDAAQLIRMQELVCANTANFKLWSKWLQNSAESMDWMVDQMKSQGLKVTLEEGYNDPCGLLSSLPHSHNFYTDDDPMGMNTGANHIAQAWADIFTGNGGRIDYTTRALYLEREDGGRVTSAVAERSDGTHIRYAANKAIVLATGDFSKDSDMMACFRPDIYEVYKGALESCPMDYDTCKVFTGTMHGDGQKMGLWVGAAWQRTPCGHMVMGPTTGPNEGAAGFYGINLDKTGKRFMNEIEYGVFSANGILAAKDRTIFSVWDDAFYDTKAEWHPWGMVVDGTSGVAPTSAAEMRAQYSEGADMGIYYRADTLEGLFEQMDGIDVEEALASVERYNKWAEQGEDEEFHVPPSELFPIATPPFYGAKSVDGAFLCVAGGLRTNENMQVCDENDVPIPGLYNTGIMTGDYFPRDYDFVVFGAAMGGEGCTLSYLLGRDLAKL